MKGFMQDPNGYYKATYSRHNVRGGKIYLPELSSTRMVIHLRGTFKTAVAAENRAERFLSTWKRWHVIWQIQRAAEPEQA